MPPGAAKKGWTSIPAAAGNVAVRFPASIQPEMTSERMKILMMVPDCYMIDRRVVQQARTLVRAGHEVALLAGFECPKAEQYEVDGVQIHRCVYDWDDERLKRIRAKLPDNDRLKMFVNRIFMKVARRFFSITPFDTFVLARGREFDADVVHVHDLPLLKHAAILAAEKNARLVFDSHEIYHEQEDMLPRLRRQLLANEKRCVPKCDIFITVNEAIADFFEKLHGKRPMVLLNCADPPPPGFDATSRHDLRQKAGLPDNARVVIYQGWISAERNLATLVQAAEHLPENTYLVMIGYGAYEPELKKRIEGKPWQDRVRFLGRVEPEHIMAMTAGADLGVIPYQAVDLNHRLCSPNKFFEYVQTYVPILAHELPFFEKMGERYGVVATDDLSNVVSMGRAINRLIDDPNRLDKMRQACRRAATELNWEVESRKLLDAYEKMGAARRQ